MVHTNRRHSQHFMPIINDNKVEQSKILKVTIKAFDALIFVAFVYFGIEFYQVDHKMFDMIGLLAIAYIAIRKPDVNTLSLIFILLMASVTPAIIIYSNEQISGYWLYAILFVINLVGVIAIWSRTFILLRYGPTWVKNYAANIHPNRQDQVMGLLFTIQGLWQLLQFLEHLVRHRNDIGLGGLLDGWVPMLFYNMYKTGQFGFSIITLLILYFMTFEMSKIKQQLTSDN